MKSAISALLLVCGAAVAAAAPVEVTVVPPAPPLTFTLRDRQACAIPTIIRNARADGGYIDVTLSPTNDVLTATLSGVVAAEACPAGDSIGRFCIYLDQEFEVTSTDEKIKKVKLTLDSSLIGYLRSHGNSRACMKQAQAWFGQPENAILTTQYQPVCVSGGSNKSCNWKNPPQDTTVVLGKYSLHAKFIIEAVVPQTWNICNGPAAADFSPDAVLPPEFVHEHDAFQGIAKKNFGFVISLTAAKPDEPPAANGKEAPAKTAYRLRTLKRTVRVQPAGRMIPMIPAGYSNSSRQP